MKYSRKIFVFVLFTILAMPLSISLGCYLNYMLSSNFDMTLEVFEVIKRPLNSQTIIFIICIEALFMMLFFMLIFMEKYGIYKANTERITNNIHIPKHYGEGQYGTSRFATDKEFDNTYTKLRFNKNEDYLKSNISSGGVVVKHRFKGKYEEINIVSDNKHLIC